MTSPSTRGPRFSVWLPCLATVEDGRGRVNRRSEGAPPDPASRRGRDGGGGVRGRGAPGTPPRPAGVTPGRHTGGARPGGYAMPPATQSAAWANKHVHSPARGPFIRGEAEPVSERDDVEATIASFRHAVGRGVYNACD